MTGKHGPDRLQEPLEAERLAQEDERLGELERRGLGPSRHEDDRQVRMSLPEVRRELGARHARHLQVCHEEVDRLIPGKRRGFFGRGRHDSAPALRTAGHGHQFADPGLVVNDQGDQLRAVDGRRPGSCRRVEPTLGITANDVLAGRCGRAGCPTSS